MKKSVYVGGKHGAEQRNQSLFKETQRCAPLTAAPKPRCLCATAAEDALRMRTSVFVCGCCVLLLQWLPGTLGVPARRSGRLKEAPVSLLLLHVGRRTFPSTDFLVPFDACSLAGICTVCFFHPICCCCCCCCCTPNTHMHDGAESTDDEPYLACSCFFPRVPPVSLRRMCVFLG